MKAMLNVAVALAAGSLQHELEQSEARLRRRPAYDPEAAARLRAERLERKKTNHAKRYPQK